MKMVFVLFFVFSTFAFAPSIAVQMAQHDIDRDTLRESTFILEDGILDTLFESGFIVSSLPISINKDTHSTQREIINQARLGYINYVVCIDVYYSSYGISAEEALTVTDIESIDWRIVNTSSLDVLSNGKILAPSKKSGETDVVAIKRFSNDVGVEIEREFGEKL